VRAVCDPDNIKAEFAIQVATHWQGKGLGRVLLDKLKNYLRQRGTQQIMGQCLRENTEMISLAHDAGFIVSSGASPDTMALHQLL
jgi:acetyltransferase